MVESYIRSLADTRTALLDTVGALSDEQAARAPSDDAWSPSEILHHLARVEHGIAIMLTRGISRARASGANGTGERPAPRPSRLEGLGIESGATRIVAPDSLAPTRGIARDEALAALTRARTALLDAIAGADGFDLGLVRFDHPRFGELDGYEWLDFIARHERRHTGQIVAAVSG